jgi:hypothetical protein
MPTPPPPQTNQPIPKSRNRIRSLDVPPRLLRLSRLTQLRNLQAHHSLHPTQRRVGRVQSLLGHSARPRPAALRPPRLLRLLRPHELALPNRLPHLSRTTLQLQRPRVFRLDKSGRCLRSGQHDPALPGMRVRSANGADLQCDVIIRFFVHDRSLSLELWDSDPKLWRELVAWLAGCGGVVDVVGTGGGFGTCDGGWVALFDAVDVEEDLQLRGWCVSYLVIFVHLFMLSFCPFGILRESCF